VVDTHANDVRFREFVAARSAALLRLAFLLSGDPHLAEDLLQTALTRTYVAWRRSDRIDSLEAYVRRAMLNIATSWWRRRWRGERPTQTLPEQPISDETDRLADRDAMWQALHALPARQRAVIVLRYYEDLTESDVAAELGLSVGTVKSYTARALATLRLRFGDDPGHPRTAAGASQVATAKEAT
jgi:RNA polymerase sigma-70 factor (ECF subfamily)